MNKLFFADPVKNTASSYNFLMQLLNQPILSYSPYCKTSNYYDIFLNIIVSLLLDEEITILDYDLSDSELDALLFDVNILNDRRDTQNPFQFNSIHEVLEKILASKKWRISLFTSGTTGTPKKISHSFDSLTRATRVSEKHQDNIWGFAYNPTHIAGLQVFFQAFLNLNTVVNIFGLQRMEVFRNIEKYSITHISATPTYYRMLLPFERPFDSIERITSGGEKLDTQLMVKLQMLFPKAKFLNVYASTEAGTIFASKGDVFTVKDDFREFVRIDKGELLLHQDLLGESKAMMFDGEWYRSGDMIEVVDEQPLQFRFAHRRNEMINVGGYKVNPYEVEDVIRRHPAVKDARVYGKTNSVLGKIVVCDVVPGEADANEREIRQFLNGKLQEFKIPRIINLVQRSSTTRTGKLQR